jgi:katanin p60 ATPase-containing subunit A1
VNLDVISETIDGYSGADITNVCRDACYMPLRNKIRGVNPEELRRMAMDEGNIHEHILS